MRLTLTIIITKALRYILKRFGRGSSMPGKVALKLYPNVLKDIKLPKYIIAVTGSNGKTSTVEMVNQVLINSNYTVAYNSEGSNQIDGIVTLVLSNCSLDGNFNKDVLLLESDERYAQYSFKHFSPTHYVITNLGRDQMTRNGNPEFVLGEIKKSIKDDSVLILNADDPTIMSLDNNVNKAYFFGIKDNLYTKEENNYLYNDGYYCPKCKSKLIYSYHQYGHIGEYHCSNCNFKRKKLNYYVSDVDFENEKIVINDKYDVELGLSSITYAYNILAAYSVCNLIGCKPSKIVESLNDYTIKNGRVINFALGLNRGMLLISKHENSVCYNQNIEYITNQNKDCVVFIMVDAISRKYFTSETSWLWDINFENLNSKKIKKIILTGSYAEDLAVRLSYTNVKENRLYINPNINEAIDYVKNENSNFIYVLTCFSDEKKFIKEVNVTW